MSHGFPKFRLFSVVNVTGVALSGALLLSCGAGDDEGRRSDMLGPGGDNGGGSAVPIPCEVQDVLARNCMSCHGPQPLYGAPMSLTTIDSFHGPAMTDTSVPMFHKVHERVNNATMPPTSVGPMVPADLATLNAWLESGAPAGNGGTCTGGGALPGMTPNDVTNPNDPPVNNPPNDTFVPPTNEVTDVTTLPSGTQCHIFRAHGQANAGDTSPYFVGVINDAYINFSLNAPWQGIVWATSFRPITENPAVVHHYLLYKEGAAVPEGAIRPGIGEHPGSELTYGWAPGQGELVLPPGVGFEMPATGYTLELHYNSSDPNAVDNSGVEVCYSTTPPVELANMTWLGTDVINGTQAGGSCNPWINGTNTPIHILNVWPHMHIAGVHMNATIHRADGTQEILHDAPFDFNYQVSYQKDVWINPGDTISTTCFYNRPSVFGQATTAEMCYLFTVATPGGFLSDGGSIAHGPNTCGVKYGGFL